MEMDAERVKRVHVIIRLHSEHKKANTKGWCERTHTREVTKHDLLRANYETKLNSAFARGLHAANGL